MPAPFLLEHGQFKHENHPMMLCASAAPSPTNNNEPISCASAQMHAPAITLCNQARIGMQIPSTVYQDATFLSQTFTNMFRSMSTVSAANSSSLGCPAHAIDSVYPVCTIPKRSLANDSAGTKHHIEYNLNAEGSKKRRISEDSRGTKKFKSDPAVPVSQGGTSNSGSSQSTERENLSSSNIIASSYLIGISQHGGDFKTSVSSCSNNDIPDLLVGFDKHVASMKQNATEAITLEISEDSHFFAGAGCGESPYITSKSFDEFHKHLGKGLSSDKIPNLDLNNPTTTPDRVQSSAGGFYPNVHFAPSSAYYAYPCLDAPSQYLHRPSSISNFSDLTNSD